MRLSKYKGLIRAGVTLLSFVLVQHVFSQDIKAINDSTPEKKNRKNTVKLNLTSPMIFGDNNYVLGYERTIGNHQSFSVHVGTFSLGRLININTDSIKGINKDVKSVGMSMSGDYRFYLAKENKFNSPHGVYIGPYFAYNAFNRDFELEATTEAFTGKLNADFRFSVATIGFQLGYQFVFRDRITLDMILFGPGFSWYKLKTSLSTNLDPDQESELFQKINEKLQEKIPGYSLVLEPETFEKSGSTNTTSLGYRYIVMLGFRF
jgi:hypothetical protein